MKTTATYWNPLDPSNADLWEDIDGADGNLKQLTLAVDADTGDYTRLTWFRDGFYTGAFGAKSHPYPEEILIVSGRLYDEVFSLRFVRGAYWQH